MKMEELVFLKVHTFSLIEILTDVIHNYHKPPHLPGFLFVVSESLWSNKTTWH